MDDRRLLTCEEDQEMGCRWHSRWWRFEGNREPADGRQKLSGAADLELNW